MIALLAKLVPAPYRVAAAITTLVLWTVLVVALSSAVGWKVSRWKADAHWSDISGKCAVALAESNASVSNLRTAVGNQNQAVEDLRKQSEGITRAQEAAKKAADEAAGASTRRISALERALSQGATCDQALKGYWEGQP